MTKILFGINKLHVGGAERLVLLDLARIDRKRFDPYLVTVLPPTQPSLDLEAAYLGKRWKHIPFRGFADVLAFWRLYRFLRREKFDVVVANLFFTGVVLRVAAVLARVPVILIEEVNISIKEKGISIFIDRLLGRYTDAFMAVSSEVIQSRATALRLSSEKFVLNYSAVDAGDILRTLSPENRRSSRDGFGLSDDDVVIVTAGRLTEQKGHRYLIDAFAQLAERKSLPPVRLLIFGEGGLRAELASQIKQHGVEHQAELPGVAPFSTIAGTADIFVMPSLWEGLSVALIEAAVAGLPIVATEVSGTREVVKDGVNGFVVPPKDTSALADKLGLLVTDASLRSKFGKASVEYGKRFSIEERLNILYRVVDETLARKRQDVRRT